MVLGSSPFKHRTGSESKPQRSSFFSKFIPDTLINTRSILLGNDSMGSRFAFLRVNGKGVQPSHSLVYGPIKGISADVFLRPHMLTMSFSGTTGNSSMIFMDIKNILSTILIGITIDSGHSLVRLAFDLIVHPVLYT